MEGVRRKFLLSLVRLLSLGLLSRGALCLLSHGGLLRLRTKSGCAHADALWLIVLRSWRESVRMPSFNFASTLSGST